ncbi:MAG: hypothetical protein HZB91_03985 [Elusimicrobia bacterium]|nr:hypothetical protein [Elusimicrobiota bacterium]
MSDLIGLKKYSKPSDSEPGRGDPSAPATTPSTRGPKPFGSQGMWMGLLVVDSLLIAVFGSYLGVVGMKAYHQWRSGKPSAASQAKPAKPAAKTEPAKAETPSVPAPVDAKAAAEPAKPAAKPEPAKPAAKAESAKPVAKAEPAKPVAKPEPAKEPPAKDSAPAEPAGDAGVKALPVDFSYHAPDAESVRLAGAFLVRGGGKKDMVRNSQGEWNLTLYLKPGTYRYWFVEDGKRKVDPQNSKVERGASVVVVYPK